ncbi:hypothetical protein Droror1_Dr00009841 [Drosera rotundifolia]
MCCILSFCKSSVNETNGEFGCCNSMKFSFDMYAENKIGTYIFFCSLVGTDVMMEGATWDITVSERNFRAEVKAHIMSKLKRWSRLAFLLPLGLLALPSLLFLVVHLLRWSVLFFSLYNDWLQ